MNARVAWLAAWLRRHGATLAVAVAAAALAWWFVVGVWHHAREFGLPLEDAYIYLTYAKQFGRAEPFTYFHGGGYSAGSTSVLWPMLLAPFWTLGARGHALVWVSFGMCAALFAATCVACQRLAAAIAGPVAGVVAAALVLAIAPFAWTALSGMEVAFASALLVAMLCLLARAPHHGPPSPALAVVMTATSLSRPESMLLVGFAVGVAVIQRLRQRDVRAAAWWAAPLVAPVAWLAANKLLAGHLMPNTGVAKSHFYLPGFDWTYWWTAVTTQSGQMLRRLFWQPDSPLVWPRLVAVLWLVGALRVAGWARRERRRLVGALVVASPFALSLAVIASSGLWGFHNYRYIAPAFPLWMATAACAFAPLGGLAARAPRAARALGIVVPAGFIAVLWWQAVPAMREDIALFAQDASDLERQVVTLGRYVAAKLPGASIMFHDAGAVSYYGDTPVFDMLGLVTNRQAEVATNGPGARFEFLEALPPERRPTHFVYYRGWMGQDEFFGDTVLATPLPPAFSRRRLIGGLDMQLIAAVWDHVHTAERPFAPIAGWHLTDRVDVADIAAERAHGWTGSLGRRAFGDPSSRWSVFHREIRADGLALDGGRTIRGPAPGERFTVAVSPGKPVQLVMRTGGKRSYPSNDDLAARVTVVVTDETGTARATLAPPTGALVEVVFALPAPRAETLTIHVAASGPYRVFHWFVLQPD